MSVYTVYVSDALILLTSQVKVRPYTALAKASRADDACSRFSGLISWWWNTQRDRKVRDKCRQAKTDKTRVTRGSAGTVRQITVLEQTLHTQEGFVNKCLLHNESVYPNPPPLPLQWSSCVWAPPSAPTHSLLTTGKKHGSVRKLHGDTHRHHAGRQWRTALVSAH